MKTHSHSPLPTIFYFLNDRKNWQLCYKLNDGSWETLDYISIHKCSVMLVQCAKLGIEARARVRGRKKSPLLLNLFLRGVSGRTS